MTTPNPIDTGFGRSSPLPPRYNLRIVQGDDFSLAFRVYDVHSDGSRDARGLTGTVLAQIRAEQDRNSTLIATFTVNSSQFNLGIVELTLTDTITGALNLPGGVGYYDVQYTEGSITRTWFRGRVSLVKDASN